MRFVCPTCSYTTKAVVVIAYYSSLADECPACGGNDFEIPMPGDERYMLKSPRCFCCLYSIKRGIDYVNKVKNDQKNWNSHNGRGQIWCWNRDLWVQQDSACPSFFEKVKRPTGYLRYLHKKEEGVD